MLGEIGFYLLVAAGCLLITSVVAIITYNIKRRS